MTPDAQQKLPKILVVRKETAESNWNRHLPVPLQLDERVLVSANQNKVESGYVRVKHGTGEKRAESIFAAHNFLTLSNKQFQC